MNANRSLLQTFTPRPTALVLLTALILPAALAAPAPLGGTVPANHPANKSAPIPMDQVGTVAGKQYKGDGLSVAATPGGARLRCVFQKLEGHVTREGLWLTSTAEGAKGERFRVVAVAVGRDEQGEQASSPAPTLSRAPESLGSRGRSPSRNSGALPPAGEVALADQVVRLIRPVVTEEYSVSVDGVRQDFIVAERPEGTGQLRVELAVTGAKVEPLMDGARLVLDGSGRKIAYSRLRATDAQGKELTAHIEVVSGILPDGQGAHPAARTSAANPSMPWLSDTPESAALEASLLRQARRPVATRLAVVVDDADALYPVRIDPTFSDDNWISLGGLPGANNSVYAAVADGGGNLYIGGDFTIVGDVMANRVAKWNGSTWSALGSGMNSTVYALALSGSDLYAGGRFTTAGGSAANYIAKWNGSTWSALGSGMWGFTPCVSALAVSGSDLYAGGDFTVAGGSTADYIAKWNGSAWSALGAGMSDQVYALAVSGSTLYAGGNFTTQRGGPANYIAQWNGSEWSALGAELNDRVLALAVSGSDLYAGGGFTMAGGSAANYIAKWNGSVWSNLGSGLGSGIGGNSPAVYALAVSGSDLYAGGIFATAGGDAANCIAKWNGSTWSALGAGMGSAYPYVWALAVSGGDLYAGGLFTTAGGSAANHIAKWNGSAWSALGAGTDGSVSALAVLGSDLYACGYFITAGGSAANYIAKWNGTAWSALGSGLGSGSYPSVNALAVSGSDLYAGGDFSTAGGSPARSIAKWDGSAWSALGEGIIGVVHALGVSGTDLYAGGVFSTTGGSAGNYIAKWNGNAWSALGSGADNLVYALAVSGTNLYAGGYFTTAGNKVSAYAALAHISAAGGRFGSVGYSPAMGCRFTFSDATLGQPYRIQSCWSLAGGHWADLIGFNYPGPVMITDFSALRATNKFYRAVTP